jgi:uncharacterized circularly permuted ATP-grasp superfamily protein/uncharacterized alpha-E superfamily protein
LPAPATSRSEALASPGAGRGWQERFVALSQAADTGHFDEARNADGSLRPLWQRFAAALGGSRFEGFARHAATVARLIAQHGVSYNVYDTPHPGSRPWSLNPVPFLLPAQEWRHLARAVAQRARLLEAILRDVYHHQSLLHRGLLPVALLKGHPGYLRSVEQVQPPGGLYLHIAAFDLARGPDGQWWVVGHRTQSPSGLGYVLENRLIVSKLFPEAFSGLRIQHIAASYRRLLVTLTGLAQRLSEGEAPSIVLLTPGPFNETYFEHAYLAGYLGLPLVEGGDLVTRGDRLYLKTIQGLRRVHGVLRRLDDEYLDPLELRNDSSLGIPGLVQVIRAGEVLIANALGTGFLESPAIQGFLPAIAQHLLREPLLLPSLHTWWCGEAAALDAIEPLLRTQVVKPTLVGSSQLQFQPVIAAHLDKSQLGELKARIRKRPEQYTTQTHLPFSQPLTWQEDRLVPKTAMLRVFAIASGAGQWEVLPGGMTRISHEDPHTVSLAQGGSTLDTWVAADGDIDAAPALPTLVLRRVGSASPSASLRPVSSRAAENLFWLGRYTERAEFMARLAKEVLLAEGGNDEDLSELWRALGRLATAHGLVATETPLLVQSPKVFTRSLIAALRASEATSLESCLRAIDSNLRALRDLLPADHVRLASLMREELTSADPTLIATVQAIDNLNLHLAALTGLQTDRMTRDLSWHMLMLGRLIERLINMSETLSVYFSGSALNTHRGFESILIIFDSIITYRARYQAAQEPEALIELLVHDASNPRALARILHHAGEELGALPDPGGNLLRIAASIRQHCSEVSREPIDAVDPAATADPTDIATPSAQTAPALLVESASLAVPAAQAESASLAVPAAQAESASRAAPNISALAMQLIKLGREFSEALVSRYFAHVQTRSTRS